MVRRSTQRMSQRRVPCRTPKGPDIDGKLWARLLVLCRGCLLGTDKARHDDKPLRALWIHRAKAPAQWGSGMATLAIKVTRASCLYNTHNKMRARTHKSQNACAKQ